MFAIQNILTLALSAVLFGVKVFALVDCIARDESSFARAETLAKNGWIVILVLAVVAHFVRWNPLSILNLVGTVAALVYLAQLRGSSS